MVMVRIGDRFVNTDGDRITITSIDSDPVRIGYSVLGEHGAGWNSYTGLPLPIAWVKAGSGPSPIVICGSCLVDEAEPGQVYCWTCTAMHASEWAQLSEEDALSKTIRLVSAQGAATKRNESGDDRDGQDSD